MATTIVPTVGLTALATTFLSTGTYIAVGDSATAPYLAGTTMGSELDRNAITTSAVSGATVTFESFFTTTEPSATLTKTIREIGLFTASSSGTLLVHAQPVLPVEKTVNKTMLVTISVTFANA